MGGIGFNGLVGFGSSIINSYYDLETTGQNKGVDASPKTTAEMQDIATYEGWDFDLVWEIGEDAYPNLRLYQAIRYASNGATRGTAPNDSFNYKLGDSITVLGNIGNLEKDGYTFAGWDILAYGLGPGYTEGDSILMGPNPVILYAQWKVAAINTDTTTAVTVAPDPSVYGV